jgi:NAD(P)H-hydrate repair Nnr-like enzyme with NAD(P)H-hydrate dehydratase domain
MNVSIAHLQADRVTSAIALAKRFNAVVVLKGAGTVIAASNGRYFINTSGNPGMASGGMGDALSGMIAAFLAQGLKALDAAKLAVYLHGAAADACLSHGMAPLGLTASEVIFEARMLLNAGLEHPDH